MTPSDATLPENAVAALSEPPLILLSEDDAVLRRLLRSTLLAQGYAVLESSSRSTALKTLREQAQVGVAIVDLGLPPLAHTTLEGLALIRAINDEFPQVKTVVLTGQDEENSALEAIREGAFDFLSKPASTEDILRAVRRAALFHRKERTLMAGGLARLQLNARYTDGLKAVREDAEEKLVRQVLRATGFNVYQSAERLGIKRESLYYFMKKFQITRDDN